MFRGILLVAGCLVLLSCQSGGEQDDLAKAQQCLDEVPLSNPNAADACFTYVAKYSSQQANILKCSIKMTSGGLMEDKILAAYKALKDEDTFKNGGTNNTEAAYLTVLALDNGASTPTLADYTAGYEKAKVADKYCQATGLAGLRFLSGAILQGSLLAKTIYSISGGTVSFDINNPATVNTAIDNLMTACIPDPSAAGCGMTADDLSTLGSSATTLASSYCNNTTADQSVCSAINEAVDDAGGDSSEVGIAMMCAINHKNYNGNTSPGTCQ